MLRELDGLPVWMTAISAGRPGEVSHMEHLCGPLTWYCPEDEWSYYRQSGASGLREGSSSSVVPVRNRALKDAWDRGVPCVQLDDDLVRVMKVLEPMKRSEWWYDPEHVHAMMAEALARLARSPYKLAGAAPTNNAYFTRHRTTTRGFCRSGFWAIEPCDLWLDEGMQTKFDYDYTIQHVRKYNGVQRCDDLIFDFDVFTKRGGHQDSRTKPGEYEAIAYLQRKWGTKIVVKNPKRDGEVLLKFRKPERVVLT